MTEPNARTNRTAPVPLAHLPALDGLRAIAVATVVAYHLGLVGQRGGFLGVDLFFVISGYLITTLLLREHGSTGRVALGSFWVRRFRRLVPPLVVMLGATILTARAVGAAQQWDTIRNDALATLGYVANWRFIVAEQSYFEQLLAPSPLRHMWSLAVEEQWYLVWPLVVVGLVRFGRQHLALAVTIGATLASALAMVVQYDPADPSVVYYATHTRAQQLLVGAVLAWVLHLWPQLTARRDDPFHRALALAALFAFAAATVVADDEAAWLYRGGFLALSVIAAVIVWATASPDGGPLGWLTAPPLRWLGVRSYALYLWHWPVIVFIGGPIDVGTGRWATVAIQIVVSLALADLTHRLIEQPIRGLPRAVPERRRAVGSAWVGATAVVALLAVTMLRPVGIATTAAASDGLLLPELPAAPTATAPTTTATTPLPTTAATTNEAPVTTTPATTAPTTTEAPEPGVALVIGDSTVFELTFAASTLPHASDDWTIVTHSRLGCGITPGMAVDEGRTTPTADNLACADWRDEWSASIDAVDPDAIVVMIGAWEVLDHQVDGEVVRFPGSSWSGVVSSTLADAIDVIRTATGAPILMATLPCMDQLPNASMPALARNDFDRVTSYNRLLADVSAGVPNLTVIDTGSVFCAGPDSLDVDPQLRYDGVHVTPEGGDQLVAWLLEELNRAAS